MTSRALSILGAFDSQHPLLTLSEIARRSDTPVATCHRLLAELTEWGALARTPGGYYHVGHRLWSLGMLAPVQRGLRDVAAPYMQDLLFVTRQVVNLFVLDGQSALLLERISGTGVGKPVAKAGDRLPLHTSAAGKVFLAYAHDAAVRERVLVRETPHSIVDPMRLLAEIRRVRRQGYATTLEEHAVNTRGVAVPVRLDSGVLIAALGIVVVGADVADTERSVMALQIAAKGIAREMKPLIKPDSEQPDWN